MVAIEAYKLYLHSQTSDKIISSDWLTSPRFHLRFATSFTSPPHFPSEFCSKNFKMGNYSDYDRDHSWSTKYGEGKYSSSSSYGSSRRVDKYGGSSSSKYGPSSDSKYGSSSGGYGSNSSTYGSSYDSKHGSSSGDSSRPDPFHGSSSSGSTRSTYDSSSYGGSSKSAYGSSSSGGSYGSSRGKGLSHSSDYRSDAYESRRTERSRAPSPEHRYTRYRWVETLDGESSLVPNNILQLSRRFVLFEISLDAFLLL